MAYNLFVKQPQYEYERSRDDYYDERKGNRDFEHDKTLVGVQSDNDLTKLAMQYRNEKELQGMQNSNDLAKIAMQHRNDRELADIEQGYKRSNAADDFIYGIALNGQKKSDEYSDNKTDPIMQAAAEYAGAESEEEKRSILKQIADMAYGEGK